MFKNILLTAMLALLVAVPTFAQETCVTYATDNPCLAVEATFDEFGGFGLYNTKVDELGGWFAIRMNPDQAGLAGGITHCISDIDGLWGIVGPAAYPAENNAMTLQYGLVKMLKSENHNMIMTFKYDRIGGFGIGFGGEM